MNTLQDCLNRRAYKQALVYLWCLAHDDRIGGGNNFEGWSDEFDEAGHKRRVDDLIEAIEVGNTFIAEDQNEGRGMLALLTAIDNVLARELGLKRRQTELPIADPRSGRHHWVLARRLRPQGYLYKNPTKLAWFHPNHVVLPELLMGDERKLTCSLSPEQPWMDTQEPWPHGAPEHLRIAVASFDDGGKLEGTPRGRGVAYQTVEPADLRLEQARLLIQQAEEQGADILLFPELTLPPELRDRLRDALLERARKRQSSRLKLIGLGSFHQDDTRPNGEPTRRNRACLVAGRDGRILLWQDKFNRASYLGQDESFQPGDQVNLLSTSIGLTALAICKALFDESSHWVWRRLSPDWLLVPSMSNDLKRHIEHTADLWKRHGCVCVVVNQCIEMVAPHPWSYLHCDIECHAGAHLECFDVPVI